MEQRRTTDWDQFPSWHLVLPPNRPTEENLHYISQRLDTFHAGDVLVLGSTIEFLDVLAGSGRFTTYVIDNTPRFYLQMERYRLFPNRERLIVGDWLEVLPAHRDKFDIVLSDFTSGNIPYEERGHFYSAIFEALKPDGIFIDRVLQPGPAFYSLDELDKRYESRPANLRTLNDFSSEYLFLSELVKKAGRVDTSDFYNLLQSRRVSVPLTRLAHLSEFITPRDQCWDYGRPPERLTEPADVGLTVIEVVPGAAGSVYEDYVTQRVFQRADSGCTTKVRAVRTNVRRS